MGAFFMMRKMLISQEALIATREIALISLFFFTMLGEMVLETSLGV